MRNGNSIYLDHQASTPVLASVMAEIQPFFSDCPGNPHSSDHSVGWRAAQAVEQAAARVADLIGATDPEEIVFTSGATEANNLSLLGLGRHEAGQSRKRVLVSAIEHKCVLAAARALERMHGYTVEQIPVTDKGFADLASLQSMIDDDVLLVSVMAVNNEIGTVQDLQAVSQIARKWGALLHCDAAQAPMAVDLKSLGKLVDMLSLSAHKMYGPKGIGACYLAAHVQDRIEPLFYGGGQQSGLRAGTVPVPLCVGLGAASEYFNSPEMEERRAALRLQRDVFKQRLLDLPWPIVVNGAWGDSRHPGNLNVQFTGFDGHEILGALQPRLAASTGSACASGLPEPSHVLRAIGLSAEEAESSIRFSLGFDTTDEEITESLDLIAKALSRLSDSGLTRFACSTP